MVDEDFPIASFDFAVVVAAEQDSVVLVGTPALDPAEDVMGLTPTQRVLSGTTVILTAKTLWSLQQETAHRSAPRPVVPSSARIEAGCSS